MGKMLLKSFIVLLFVGLTACSSNTHMAFPGFNGNNEGENKAKNEYVSSGQPIGSNAMDKNDLEKMSHALDKPLGKSTSWANSMTNTNYTVTPTQKVSISGNPYCRKYTTVAVKNDQSNESTGTACVVATTGVWEAVK